jgi:signal transduction histidine kinase
VEAQQAGERRQLEELREEVARLRASSERLARVDDDERRSIERSIHDGVQQELVGLAANLQLAEGAVDADPAATKALLAEMGREIAHTLEELRSLTTRIHPPLLETGGLGPALRMAAADAGVVTRIDVPAGSADLRELASVLYFCCLDVFENVGADATVAVSVRDTTGSMTFEIDVDRELDVDVLPVRDRIEARGGHLEMAAEAGRRTRLLGSVPLPT